MQHFILRRIGYSLVSLFLLSLTIFLFVRLTGDPASLLVEPGASAADIAAIHRQLGLDQPLWIQYWHFVSNFAQGDLGKSFYYNTPVLELYFQRLPNSLLLAAVAATRCFDRLGAFGKVMSRSESGSFCEDWGAGKSAPFFIYQLISIGYHC